MNINKAYTFYKIITLAIIILVVNSCLNANASEKESKKNQNNTYRTVSQKTKDYWFDGNAEISSFTLQQARYGEIHKGTASLVYVTEPFSIKHNTKADQNRPDNVTTLKLNTTKKFVTGIYPYSMMNTSIFPFEGENNSLKVASSIQEWCGMTYLEMNNKKDAYNFNLNSYFEGVSFKNKKINKTILENDLWMLIRLNPEKLPLGEQFIIPSMFYLNSLHKEFKAYKAVTTKIEKGDNFDYQIKYPELDRILTINIETDFPHSINGWKESYNSGYGKNSKKLTTEATRIKTLKIDYWNKKHNKDSIFRKELGL